MYVYRTNRKKISSYFLGSFLLDKILQIWKQDTQIPTGNLQIKRQLFRLWALRKGRPDFSNITSLLSQMYVPPGCKSSLVELIYNTSRVRNYIYCLGRSSGLRFHAKRGLWHL